MGRGSWPYIILAVARIREANGGLFGYGTYVEGDTATRWFRSQDACLEAITADVFFPLSIRADRRPGQPPGTGGLPEKDRKPCPAWTT